MRIVFHLISVHNSLDSAIEPRRNFRFDSRFYKFDLRWVPFDPLWPKLIQNKGNPDE